LQLIAQDGPALDPAYATMTVAPQGTDATNR
jgi:hypothetical protein